MITAMMVVAAMITPASSSSWVCESLDNNPTQAGVWAMIGEAYGRGYRSEDDARSLFQEVQGSCPNYIPLLIEWADAND
jgi:hypothetical protein